MDEDYPQTLLELERRFSSEEGCIEYLAALRWPAGWACPRCAGTDAWSTRRARWLCDRCRYEMSVTAGTIFQDSHLPLTIWFRAMWQITSQKNGISALGLQRVLGLGSYKTAWAMLHKLRRAMVRPGREQLAGVVEVDEAYWGGEESGTRGRKNRVEDAHHRCRRGGRERHRPHPSTHYPERLQSQPAWLHSAMASFGSLLRRGAWFEPTGGMPIWDWMVTSMTARCRCISRSRSTCFHALIARSRCSSGGF
jgi:transposase-like protein